MKVYLGSDEKGFPLKETVKKHLEAKAYDVVDLTPEPAEDFVDSTVKVAQEVLADDSARGLLFDEFGVGSFIAGAKIKGAIVAEVSDERSAYMTREHNNTKIITLGSELLGDTLAKNIVDAFLDADYDGGRHQIRVDMLNAMC